MKVAGLEESMAGVTNIEKAKAQGGTAFKDMFAGLVQERLDNLTEDLEEMSSRSLRRLSVIFCRMAAFW